jgi:hypothetical protein
MVRSTFGGALALSSARLEPSGTSQFPSFETPRDRTAQALERAAPHTCDKLTRRVKFRFSRRANHSYIFARLTRQEGRIAIVTNARWDAVDADAPLTNGTDADGEIVWF